MHSTALIGALMAQGTLAQLNQLQAFNQLEGSRQSTIIDETARAKYLFPPSRGSSSLVADIGPCQGFEVAGRIDYPISGGAISWSTLVDVSNIQIRYSTSDDPTSQSDFRDALTNVTGGWKGQQCIDGPNFQALGLSIGDEITMQLAYEAGRDASSMYECADLRLVSQSDFDDQEFDTSCVNYVVTTKQRRDSASNPHLVTLREEAEAAALAEGNEDKTESSDNENSQGGLSVTEAGVIGAMVTLGALGLLLILAWFAGAATFGRQTKSANAKHGSFSSSATPAV